MYGDRNTVIPRTALSKVVILEVEGYVNSSVNLMIILRAKDVLACLGKSIFVRNIVNRVYDVEGVGARCIEVCLHSRSLCRILGENEVQVCRGLARGRSLAALEGNRIVSTAVGSPI